MLLLGVMFETPPYLFVSGSIYLMPTSFSSITVGKFRLQLNMIPATQQQHTQVDRGLISILTNSYTEVIFVILWRTQRLYASKLRLPEAI